jgi:hypothetical protein
MVTGIIHLGKLFNENVGTDIQKRVKFYEERTTVVNKLVAAQQAGMAATEEVEGVISSWFEGISKQQQNIMNDMEKIAPMIGISEKE